MSASLVGSEMCIRDREKTMYGKEPKRTSWSTADSCARVGPISSEGQSPCLLYTSDAADDM
eukprot:6666531-Alexandrium_andersonii.AAC.1